MNTETYEILPLVGRVTIPAKLAAMEVAIFGLTCRNEEGKEIDVTARKFGSSLNVAIGLIKDLQGVITNFFHRAAKAACILLYSTDISVEQRASLLNALKLNEEQLKTISVDMVSCYVHQFMADAGEACMTEVLMDRRKYKKGDPNRFDSALENMSQVISGKLPTLLPENFQDGDGAHIKKGHTTVNLEAINAILLITGKAGVSKMLGHYPVTNALVGGINDDKGYALAGAIHRLGMAKVMDIVNGKVIEEAVAVEDKPTGKGKAEAVICGVERTAWKDANQHLFDAIMNANTMQDGSLGFDLNVKVDDATVRVGYLPHGHSERIFFSFPNPKLVAVMPTEHTVGGFNVNVGERTMFARHVFICTNRNAGRMAGSQKQLEFFGIPKRSVRLGTIADLLAQIVCDQIAILDKAIHGKNGANINGAKRVLRKKVGDTLLSYSRIPGKHSTDELDVYSTADLLPYQASVEQIETSSPYSGMMIKERMMELIHEGTFANPLDASFKHTFCVGASPKGGSTKHVTMRHPGTPRTLVEMISQPAQLNTDRGQREAAGYATAKVLIGRRNMITTDFDSLMPELVARCTDLVIAYVPGEGWLFQEGGEDDNPDAMYHTDDGLEATRYYCKPQMFGPMSLDAANIKAVEVTGDENANVETLVAQGWTLDCINREAGALSSVDTGKYVQGANNGLDTFNAYTKWYMLTSPEPLPESMGRKFGWMGHKSVSVHIPGRAYIMLNGKKTYIDCFAAVETVIAKKLQAEMIVGQASLLGKRHFDGTETAAEIEAMLPQALKACKARKDGRFIVYSEDGTNIGYCIPALHRTFVMKEDENISASYKADGMSASPWSTALFGSEITLTDRDTELGQMYADFISDSKVPEMAPAPESVKATPIALVVPKQALPAWWTAAFTLEEEDNGFQCFSINEGYTIKDKGEEYTITKGEYNIVINVDPMGIVTIAPPAR